MGCRLHVATKYDVEFKGDYFNHCQDAVTDFILELCQDDEAYYSDESSQIEIRKECFAQGIANLREYEFHELPVAIQKLGYSPDQLANIFKEMLNMSAPNLDYIVLCWS